mgnify:CR=1 FL=1
MMKVSERSQACTSRVFKQVNTLLDFSRLESGQVSARYEPLDLGE